MSAGENVQVHSREEDPIRIWESGISAEQVAGKKQRLLFAIDPPLSTSGGVSVLAQCLIREFSNRYDVFLLSNDSPQFLERTDIFQYLKGHIFWSPPLGPPRLEFLNYTVNKARELKDLKIELVHFHSGFFNWGNRFFGFSLPRQLRRLGIPSIWTTHGIFSLLKGYCGPLQPRPIRLLLFVSAWFGKLNQLQNTEYEVQVAKYDLKRMRAVWFPYRRKCIQIYHSKLNAVMESAQERRKTILNVGYISFNKRQDLIVRAFLSIAEANPDWDLVFVGRDTEDGCFKLMDGLIKRTQFSHRIHFLGAKNGVGKFMEACGVYVHSSDLEGLPLAVQEAMYYGCPIIASDIPGHVELLRQTQAGLLFRQGNSEDLAGQLNKLLNDPVGREKLSHAARKVVTESGMTLAGMVEKYAAIYKNVLTKTR